MAPFLGLNCVSFPVSFYLFNSNFGIRVTIFLICSESGSLESSFGPSFMIRGLSSTSRFGVKVSFPLALVLVLGCVSFPGSGLGV